jgi:O-antigen/teichoic acid export membrane protein
LLGRSFHRPQFVDNAPVLWLMMAGMWIRCNAETLYQVLFARHQDRAIWLGNMLFLVPALVCNTVLVPLVGFIGIGYSAIISSVFLLLWRGFHVRKPCISDPKQVNGRLGMIKWPVMRLISSSVRRDPG